MNTEMKNDLETLEPVDAANAPLAPVDGDELAIPEFLERTSEEDEILSVAEVQVEEDLV